MDKHKIKEQLTGIAVIRGWSSLALNVWLIQKFLYFYFGFASLAPKLQTCKRCRQCDLKIRLRKKTLKILQFMKRFYITFVKWKLEVIAFKNYFEDFLNEQPTKVQDKIFKIIEAIGLTWKEFPKTTWNKLQELKDFMVRLNSPLTFGEFLLLWQW